MRVPARLDRSRWARARWLVLAPHPDDETLGAGALIAEVAKRGRLAGVVYLTDGEGSHPERGRALAAARRGEAARALAKLAGYNPPLTWIGWADGGPPSVSGARYAHDAEALGDLLRRRRVTALAVTAANEPHCDHAAAYRLALSAVKHARRRIAVFEYLVWAQAAERPARALRTKAIRPGRRRAALQAHRSQLTPRFGSGFRLPLDRRRMARWDVLYLRDPPS